jgi:hypothetical protein
MDSCKKDRLKSPKPCYTISSLPKDSDSTQKLIFSCVRKYLQALDVDISVLNKWGDILKSCSFSVMHRMSYSKDIPWFETSTVYIDSKITDDASRDWIMICCIDTVQSRKRDLYNPCGICAYKIHLLGFIHIRDPKIWYSIEKTVDPQSNMSLELYRTKIEKDIRILQLKDFSMDLKDLIAPPDVTCSLESALQIMSVAEKPLSNMWCIKSFEFEEMKDNVKTHRDHLKTHSLRKMALGRLKSLCAGMIYRSKDKISFFKNQMDDCISFYFLSHLFCKTEHMKEWFVRAEVIYFLEKVYRMPDIESRRSCLLALGFPIIPELKSFSQCVQAVMEDRLFDFLARMKDGIDHGTGAIGLH